MEVFLFDCVRIIRVSRLVSIGIEFLIFVIVLDY
jgi:hypothetical protein